MFSYRCPNCGAAAYSSANASTVGPCPSCAHALAEADPALTISPTPPEHGVRAVM